MAKTRARPIFTPILLTCAAVALIAGTPLTGAVLVILAALNVRAQR